MDQPQSSGDFGHGCFSRPYTKLTYSFSYYRSKGTFSPPHKPETKSHTTCESPFVHSPNWKSTSCAFCLSILLQLHPSSQPEGTTTLPSLQSIADDNGTPVTWTLILSSSKSLTGRTGLQTEGRFSLLETLLEPQPGIQEYSTGQGLIARRR